jgi:hypothetical protein
MVVEELILPTHGLDHAQDEYGLFPGPGRLEVFDNGLVFFPKGHQRGLIKVMELFCQFL